MNTKHPATFECRSKSWVRWLAEGDKDLMTRIANRTDSKSFAGDPESIENIYDSISVEQ